jgi:general secretion pathway protein G
MIKALRMWVAQQDRKSMRRRPKGMTLVEIMVVITIIGLITAAVAVAVMPKLGEARTSRAQSDVKQIENALDLYKMKKGSYPDTAQGIRALVETGNLKEAPLDPWGEPYIYMLEGNKPLVMSYGADKQAGGSGEDEDVSNRSKGQAKQ